MSISLLFNGGGIANLSKLTAEMDSIVGGRGEQLGHVLTQLTSVMGSLNKNSTRIDGTLAGFSALADTIEANHQQLGQVADNLPGMIGAIAENNQALGDLLTKVSTTSAALGDYANTTSDALASLLDNVAKLMNALARTDQSLGPALDALHEIRPKADASFKGDTLAVAGTLTLLDIGLLTDPANSKFPDLKDLNDFGGSLIQVLQIIYGRVNGGTDELGEEPQESGLQCRAGGHPADRRVVPGDQRHAGEPAARNLPGHGQSGSFRRAAGGQ